MNRSLLKVGVIGTAVSAICCFTPVLGMALVGAGAGAALVWLDWILLPALVGFAGLTLWAWRQRGNQHPNEGS